MTNRGLLTLQICRWVLAFVWIYQGLVPKWLGPHADELAMNMALGFSLEQARLVSYVGGSLEVLLGLGILFFYRQIWIYAASLIAIGLLYVFTLLIVPQFLVSAFNSTTSNLPIAALSLIAMVELRRVRS
jgi:hypothetical protein